MLRFRLPLAVLRLVLAEDGGRSFKCRALRAAICHPRAFGAIAVKGAPNTEQIPDSKQARGY